MAGNRKRKRTYIVTKRVPRPDIAADRHAFYLKTGSIIADAPVEPVEERHVDTGIYVTRQLCPPLRLDDSELPPGMESPPVRRVDPHWERHWLNSRLSDSLALAKQLALAEDARVVEEAKVLLWQVERLQKALAGADDPTWALALLAFEAGKRADRLLVMPREHLALDGLAQQANRDLIRRQKQCDAETRHREYRQSVDAELTRQKRSREKPSLNRAIKAVATKGGVSVSTIKRAIKKGRVTSAT